jgi:uncharacterized protein (TIGR02284 family)
MNHEKTLDTLNSLLRGELAATETYQQALAKVGTDPLAADLRAIHAEHRDSANELRKHVHHHGGKPDQDSGAWGTFAKAITGTAKIFGETAAMKALKEGEEQGLSDYEKALKNPDLPEDCRKFISSTLMPRTRSHLSVLDRLMSEKSRP